MPAILIFVVAAVLGLATTIFLILTNPSRIPLSTRQTASSPTPLIEAQLTTETEKQNLVNQAKDDLAKKTGLAASEIILKDAQSMTWPDTSLGCPKPGFMYAQVLTPGYRILLQAGGKTYDYRGATSSNRIAVCETPADQ